MSIITHLGGIRLGLIIGLALIGLTFTASAQEETPSPTVIPSGEVQGCADCHVDVLAVWQNSPHAVGYHDERFQASLLATEDQQTCLGCHTTGFSLRTGTFTHEGVTCEACHGENPPEHPDPLKILPIPSAETCGDCHTTTYQEWSASLHGENQLACNTCHDPHKQGFVKETTQAICLDCHEETLTPSYAHVTHPEQTCADCHWYRAEENHALHVVDGSFAASGHNGIVLPRACNDCHADLDEEFQLVQNEFNASANPLEAQVRLRELQSEAEQVRAQSQNAEAVNLIQGLLLGVAVGGVAILLIGQVRKRI